MKELHLECKGILSDSENKFVIEILASKVLPTLKHLIKDHKKVNADDEYPNRLVIPARVLFLVWVIWV